MKIGHQNGARGNGIGAAWHPPRAFEAIGAHNLGKKTCFLNQRLQFLQREIETVGKRLEQVVGHRPVGDDLSISISRWPVPRTCRQ